MPDFNKYPTLKPFWKGFIAYKDSEEAKHISEANKMNAKKNLYPHRMGSCGYVGKKDDFQKMEEKVTLTGNTLVTATWTERSKRYIYGHGVSLTPKGDLTFVSDEMRELAERVEKAHIDDKFKASRDQDVLSYAL